MPVILEPKTKIEGSYTAAEKQILVELIASFRILMADDDANKNVLNMQQLTYTDDKIINLLQQAGNDINVSKPMTRFTIFQIYNKQAAMLLVKGAMVFGLLSEGLLQAKNQMNYNDAGLSVSMFDKTGLYQSWYGTMLQDYMNVRQQFKQSMIPSGDNAGFYGISSQFGYMNLYEVEEY